MYVESVPNRSSPPAILLRESHREGRKIRKRTLANLSSWPAAQVDSLRRVLRGELLAPPAQQLQITRSRPHGHVTAVLGAIRRIGLDKHIDSSASPERNLVLALITTRILEPCSKLATARGLQQRTASSSLAETLALASLSEDDLYAAMDWLLERQQRIEKRLAAQHLEEGMVVLYDISSAYFEGRHCPLAKLGHSRDERPGNLQIVFGLLTNAQGCPVAVEVFEGNTADPKTVAVQVKKLRERFRLRQLILVGDRGMLTSARIREDLKRAEGLEWITALRAPQIQRLAAAGVLQLSLFDEKDLAEITHPDYPGERLIACRNPLLAVERARKREELLAATEQALKQVQAATQRAKRALRGQAAIGLRVGRVLGRYKMAKHFAISIEENRFSYQRRQDEIRAEAALDGIYVIRTSVPAEKISSQQAVHYYKDLSVVERAFRSFKSVDLKVRPIYHHSADRVRAHVLLCMLAYYVEWHMRQALAPLLFDDHQPSAAQAARSSIVAPAQRSSAALAKAHNKQTEDGFPVHSFRTLLSDLRTIARNSVQFGDHRMEITTTPTALQQRVFQLLKIPLS
jgi:Transposase DDE domain